jgi:nitrate reductase beta subunit
MGRSGNIQRRLGEKWRFCFSERSRKIERIEKYFFHNPYMPVLEDYYIPWTYKYQDLFTAPEGDDQPTARAVSLITGEHIDIQSGPNWDDDLSGTPDYARQDVNFKNLSELNKKVCSNLNK